MEERAVIHFEGWSLHVDSGELCSGTTKVRLQEQSLQFLLELLAHPGQVVTREQLIARLWPKGVVDFDTSLNSVVRKLRQALGDNAAAPRYIETLPRKGYRFICPLATMHEPSVAAGVRLTRVVNQAVAAPLTGASTLAVAPPLVDVPEQVVAVPPEVVAPRHARRGFYALILIVLVAVAGGFIATVSSLQRSSDLLPVVAALPLVNLTDERSNELLCDSVADELAAALAQLPGLRVVGRNSAASFKRSVADVVQIGRKLHASHVVRGTLRRVTTGLQIDVELVRTADGVREWQNSFDIGAAYTLSIHNRMTREIAQVLRLHPTTQTLRRLAARQPANDAAFDFYRTGQQLWLQRTKAGNAGAIDGYVKAIAADPNYALAYVGLAEALLNQIYLDNLPAEPAIARAAESIETALRLDSELPEALAAQGMLLAEQSHRGEAAAQLQKAVESSPNDAAIRGKLARVLSMLGQPQSALEQYRLASELDPLDVNVHVQQCFILQDLAKFDAAASECKEAIKVQPRNSWGHFATAQLWRNQGRLDEALRQNQLALRLDPENELLLDWHIELQLMLGLNEEAYRTQRELVRVSPGAYHRSQASIVLVREGKAALLEYLKTVDPALTTKRPELIDLARAYYVAGESRTAARLFGLAERLPGSQRDYLLDPTEVANDFSGSLYLAAVHLANGESAAAHRELDALEAMLSKLEAAGVDCYGLHSLRAQAQVLRGDDNAAMASLQRAVQKGWLWTWRARYEPLFEPLRKRKDYQALMANTEQRIDALRSAVKAAREGRRTADNH